MQGYQLKITIKGSSPPIWRRVIVPEGISFVDLDRVIEYLFGWQHSHLYEFRQEDISIMEEPEEGEEDAKEELIDDWFVEKEKWLYTYDFGDNWEHTILVEKIVEYEERFPIVVKSKGPNMIEDCGGIWSFFDIIDQAEPFDMEKANAYMRKYMVFEKKERKENENNNLIDLEYYLERIGDREEEEEFDLGIEPEEIKKIINNLQEEIGNFIATLTLKDIFEKYPKEALIDLARSNQLSGYTRLKKEELIDWLLEKIMAEDHMEDIIHTSDRDDIEFIETLIQKGHQYIPLELVTDRGLLFQYCGYMEGFIFLPEEVKKKYQKICKKNSWRKKKDRAWKVQDYGRSCLTLYGIISLKEFAKIYQHYEKQSISQEEIKEICELAMEEEAWSIVDGLLIDNRLEEKNTYLSLLNMQGDLDYYLAPTKEEFLDYGEYMAKEWDDVIEGFTQFLIEDLEERVDVIQWIITMIYDMIRANDTVDEIIFDLPWHKKKNFDRRRRRLFENYIKMLRDRIRRWENRGFNYLELKEQEQKRKKSICNVLSEEAYREIEEEDNLYSFEKAKKVYPNDPCPCGSGKKYKQCCGKKKES